MKNLLKLALMASLSIGAAIADSKQDGSEARARFDGVKKVFADKGIGAIAFLNGVGELGSATGKGRGAEDTELSTAVDNFNDPSAPLICIGDDDTYIVHSGQPTLVGKSAVSGDSIWRDGVGIAVVAKARAALSRGTPNGLTTIDYVQKSDMPNAREGQNQNAADNDWLAIADSRYIPGLPAGAFCATKSENFEPRDNSDRDRLVGEDKGEGKIGHDTDSAKVVHHHNKHKNKHHKKAAADAKDAKADAKDAKADAKDAKADAKDAKDVAKDAKADAKDAKADAKDAKADAKDAKADAKDAKADAKDAKVEVSK